LAAASAPVKDTLNWWRPAGPLTGKTGVGVIVFLVSWGCLHRICRRKKTNFARMTTIAVVLFGLGLLGTCPAFFELFVKHR